LTTAAAIELTCALYQAGKDANAIRAHVVASEALDNSFGKLLNAADFKKVSTAEDYKNWVKFKMQLIARFYRKYCKFSIIGGPVDAFAITRWNQN